MIKSVLRGVSDFTKYPDAIENDKHVVWYPNPSLKRGKQDFNVFNLDPFVWFVHVKLGFSGYGFSVDDDTADGDQQFLQLLDGPFIVLCTGTERPVEIPEEKRRRLETLAQRTLGKCAELLADQR